MKNHKLKNCSYYKIITLLLFVIPFVFGCKKLIQIDPPIDSIVGQEIYNTNTTAASVLTGIYTSMSSPSIFTGQGSISLKTGLSADELISVADPSSILSNLYANNLTTDGDQLFWTDLYNYIYKCNSAIEGITASKGISTNVKTQLIAEAKFVRAFMYFYLVNLYGDVPMLTSTDLLINSNATRSEKSVVYAQIIKDLKDAQNDLNENYVASDVRTISNERLRPNKATATALLARVYLYTQQWQLAINESTKLISNTAVYQLETLDNVFLKDSKEAIWQLQPVSLGDNTIDARTFVLKAGTNNSTLGPDADNRPVYISKFIFNAFENGDGRKSHWLDSVTVSGTTYPYAYKYKAYDVMQPRTEYLMVFRLAEQFLIRAEARAELGILTGPSSAASDLNSIRVRAGLAPSDKTSQSDILQAIINERKFELFTEWGNRWMDLKRLNQIDQIMTGVCPTKGGVWASYKALYPIPVADIQRDPNLRGHQNPGYPENK